MTKPTLGEVATKYQDSIPTDGKADTTLVTEGIHIRHLLRLLGQTTRFDRIDPDAIQRYVNARAQEAGLKGNTVQPDTIKKGLDTFGLIHSFARSRGWAHGDSPTKGVKLPRRAEKPAISNVGADRVCHRGRRG